MEELTMMDAHRRILGDLPDGYYLSIHFDEHRTFIRAGKLREVRDYPLLPTETLPQALLRHLQNMHDEAKS